MKKHTYEHGKGHCGFDLYEVTEGIDKGKTLFSDKFPVAGRVEIFDAEKAKKIRRRVEDRLRKGSIGDVLAVASNLGLISDNLFK